MEHFLHTLKKCFDFRTIFFLVLFANFKKKIQDKITMHDNRLSTPMKVQKKRKGKKKKTVNKKKT